MATNPFDLSNTNSAQKNNAAGTFNLPASNTPVGQPAVNFSAITPSAGSTVSGQLNNLLSTDSPYLKEARARSQRQANSRGLINSSIAAGAGESAAIAAALPIATQDANTFFTAQRANQDAGNQFGMTNLNFTNQRNLQNDQFAFQRGESALDRSLQNSMQDKQYTFQGTQNALDRTQQLSLQGNELKFNREQLAQQAQQAELDRVQQKFLQGQQLTFEEQQLLRQQNFQRGEAALDRTQQLGLLQRELDSRRLLQDDQQNFAGEQAGFDRQQQLLVQNDQQSFLSNEAGLDRFQQRTLQDDQQGFLGDQAAYDRRQQSESLAKEITAQQQRLNTEIASREKLTLAENQLRKDLLNTQITSEKDVMRLQSDLNKSIAAFNAELNDESRLLDLTRGRNVSLQQSVATLSQQMLGDVSQIMASSEIPSDAKNGLVKSIQAQYQSVFDLLESIEDSAILSQGQGGF